MILNCLLKCLVMSHIVQTSFSIIILSHLRIMGLQSLHAWKERRDVSQSIILMRRRYGKKTKQTTNRLKKQSKIRHSEIKKKKKKSGNNFYFSLLYLVQSKKKAMKSLQQYLSRDFGLAWCHSSAVLTIHTTLFCNSSKQTCFQFLQMFSTQTAQQRFLFCGYTLLTDKTV